ncbi:hypothetical protein Cni_G03429 [Canna indica]|uniref:BRCT domain-containing protein n=1 Tax=Canna indica TaxID=4628 RepID=A0AAQ3JTG3_9LILI|nr:hypothetical protein Cni_G03429 [Canna indica]
MSSTAGGVDNEETQVLDLDSQAPGELSILYGETQALDDSEIFNGEGGWGVDVRGKTQLVDEYEETAVLHSGGEETDGTEVLSGEDEGLADDGYTHCGARENGGGVQSDLGERAVRVDNLRSGDDGKDCMVNSDASTDDDEDAGSARRSFSAVRAAAMRSSGLAAAKYFNSRRFGNGLRSFSNSKHSEKEDSALDGHTSLTESGVNNLKNGGKDLNSLSTVVGNLDLDHESASLKNYSKEGTKSRCINKTVRRLFSDSENDGNTGRDDNIVSKVDISHLLATDSVTGGLSYVVSQDPTDLCLENALETVNKFLSINDVGSSQEKKNIETEILKSPPVSGSKGVKQLAEKTDWRSPVGKPGIFDWDDDLEDESGGGIFTKRKDSFKGMCIARKTQSHPPKSKHAISGATKYAAVDKGGKEHSNTTISDKGNAFIHSDSRLMISNPLKSDRIHISETNIRKNLFTDTEGKSNSESLQHQLDTSDIGGGLQCTFDVGPDTQMAAEAMEALFHGSLVNAEKETQHPAAQRNPILKTSSKNVSRQKRTSVTDSDAIMTRSKRRKVLSTKSNKGRSSSTHRLCSTSSKLKSTLEDTTVKRQAKRRKERPDAQVDDRSFANGHDSPKSTKKEKAEAVVVRHMGEQRKNIDILVERPLAYRTRHSKRVQLLKQNETLPNDGKDSDELTEANVSRAVEAVNNLVTDASGSTETLGLDLMTGVNECHATQAKSSAPLREEFQASLTTKDGSHYPKKMRTTQVSGTLDVSLNKSLSVPGVGTSEPIERSSKQGKKKIFIRSVADILDQVKRKKRSPLRRIPLQTNGCPSTAVVRMIFGVQTIASLKFTSFKPSSYREESARTAITPTDANQEHSLHIEKAEHPKHSEQVEEEQIGKLYGPPKAKVQLSCTKPSKDVNAMSPVCTSKDTPKSCNKVASTCLGARELRRLEVPEASTPNVKDMRRRKDMASVRVLFSNHLAEDTIKQQKKILARLGLPTATSISDATHFVADKFVRTQNMLEAIAAGKPIVTPMWLESCGQASCFIDEKKYILRDAKKEKEIGFNMPVSLARGCQHPLLQGKRVFITPNVKPNRELVSSLVNASQGQAIKRIGRSAMKEDKVPDDLLVISCEEDYSICIPLLEKGAGIFSSELLLNGIVIQKLEYERHRLFSDHVKQTRSTIWLRHKDRDQFFPVSKWA